MEQFSTSKVTVECFDPHDVYKLICPGLIPRLPLRHLHWHSHAGPLRSIDTLHVEIIQSGEHVPDQDLTLRRSASVSTNQDVGAAASTDSIEAPTQANPSKGRRHQIPGLRRTPYLKALLVRCDDSESYKGRVRSEIREWIKKETAATSSKTGAPEGHDAFSWVIIHVVLPNTVAATQPRTAKSGDVAAADQKGASRWRGGSSTLLEKMKADFNVSGKNTVDRVAQVRVGINDVPYDMLPRVVPAVPSGYVETEQDVEAAWQDLITKFKDLILTSFDKRVTRYEEDIKEKDAQRMLPGWNFCTFFILKEGLARGFESVGLVEDALVGYDELSAGLDAIITEQATASDAPERHGGALLPYTDDLKEAVDKALKSLDLSARGEGEDEDDGEDADSPSERGLDADDIPIIASKKPYRDMILENNVSLFDFKSYIFARQISLLLRLGNAWSTREELLAKLNEQQQLVPTGLAPHTPQSRQTDEPENLSRLSEVCKRALEFIPTMSRTMQHDILAAVASEKGGDKDATTKKLPPSLSAVIDNMVASFAFSLAQQILAQTSTTSLPIPPSTLSTPDAHEPKLSIPEPKTMMHPARSSSLGMPSGSRPPPSPNVFPGPGNNAGPSEKEAAAHSQFLKSGLEDLAARRAELYSVCRNILEKLGRRKGWGDGWGEAPVLSDSIDYSEMEDVSLDDDTPSLPANTAAEDTAALAAQVVSNPLLSAAFKSEDDFYRLYETLTDKALRHYTVANNTHSVQASFADLAVLKHKVGDFGASASYFDRAIPFFGEGGWSLLELSMLIMYTRCLRELDRKEAFVQVVLKLLTKAAAAEGEYASQASFSKLKENRGGLAAVRGLIKEMLAASKSLKQDVVVPLSSFFLAIDICGPPVYPDGTDKVEIEVELHSLLEDDLPVEQARLRMTCVDGSPTKEISLECVGEKTIKPGKSRITFVGKVVATGRYKVDQLYVENGRIILSYERDVNQITPRDETIFKNPPVLVFQQVRSFDLQLAVARHTRLDQNNALELEISPGWNSIESCTLSVRPATGGLRTITASAKILSSPETEFSKPPEAGMIFLGAVPPETPLTISFPFSVEQDVSTIAVRLEATYVTADGTFHYAKLASIPIALALGVNVQDVFKHHALYSRFTVSTASTSPLRLFESEMTGSDVAEPHLGVLPASTMLIFPKQPGTLLYKTTRKGGDIGPDTSTTMFLKLYYSVLQDEAEAVLREEVQAALEESPLRRLARLLVPIVSRHAAKRISALDLERAALTGQLETGFFAGVNWATELQGLDHPGSKAPVVPEIASFFEAWHKEHKVLPLEEPAERKSLLIPVDIPSVPILVTADIKLGEETQFLVPPTPAAVPTVRVNQLLPATLHLRWTRKWDTSRPPGAATSKTHPPRQLSFEVSTQGDAWLLSGRRKGHITIPSSAGVDSADDILVPLILAPLREGYLPYPGVDVREVRDGDEKGVAHHCEADWRNVGEVVRVVEERTRVTVSLDASGPGGGPLVVESQGAGRDVRVLA
ncbi:related to TRS130 TRAPP subunit of 130 kDa involved in targeting and fusion of ER to golgi transport vesicles [Cephalotrichum gorgonifer]|uniref:Related to TRS130 TRAPP subunit of 130 kDa involved in targeting and fusion of ER to golgi transport vesicles n=1 Tax=Cephalotrichum gorgonifer TaxID=2041049 RepID=A0AAE8SQK8_9PEZI|nr:related to TRS130 TRAPP subunit of 130 kDa involved in targeting and fusion of ER to golgi transport vesicles [Cephalotrichum gorgonifer]